MQEIINILQEIRPEHDFNESSDFITDGLLDSFDIISLIDILQENYNILIDGLDIVPENFCSAGSIAELIRKSGGNI